MIQERTERLIAIVTAWNHELGQQLKDAVSSERSHAYEMRQHAETDKALILHKGRLVRNPGR